MNKYFWQGFREGFLEGNLLLWRLPWLLVGSVLYSLFWLCVFFMFGNLAVRMIEFKECMVVFWKDAFWFFLYRSPV